MLPKNLWRPDDEALICADNACTTRFGLIDRKHHCRRCGEIYCAAHSSRTTSLWPHPTEPLSTPPTPKATPRHTPRSSTVDIPSLAFASTSTYTSPASSGISIHSSSGSSHSYTTTPTSSPPKHLSSFLQQHYSVQVRVCDTCYFAAPTPPLVTPPLAHPSFSGARPLTLRHPHSATASSSTTSFSASHSPPPPQRRAQRSRDNSRSRSRQGSASGSSFGVCSSSAGTGSTPPTSLASIGSRSRGVSPATSMSAGVGVSRKGSLVVSEEDPEEQLEEEDEEARGGEESDEAEATEEEDGPEEQGRPREEQPSGKRLLQRDSAFGSVKGAWQSWATF